MKVKDFACEIKAGPDAGLEEGQFIAYASVFGNVDSYGDIVRPGAFKQDLADWKKSGYPVPLLYGHNAFDPDYNIGHMIEGEEDEKGLKGLYQLDLEMPKAATVYRQLKSGRVRQMSFAYDVIDSKAAKVDEQDVMELLKLKTYEHSVVLIGANQETEVLAVKAASRAMLAKAGRVLSSKNESALRSAYEQLAGAAGDIKNVLSALDSGDDGKAADTADAKIEEPDGAKVEERPAGKSPADLRLKLALATADVDL
jgi:HK97 family phage prohead protease